VARIKGNGARKPILIMGHTDVVGAQKEKWSVDPFAATRKDGYIYARGAVDDKDNATAGLMLMILLKRLNVKLDRNVMFLAEAGEESTTRFGIDYMVAEHWSEIEAEFCAGRGRLHRQSRRQGALCRCQHVGESTAPRPSGRARRGGPRVAAVPR